MRFLSLSRIKEKEKIKKGGSKEGKKMDLGPTVGTRTSTRFVDFAVLPKVSRVTDYLPNDLNNGNPDDDVIIIGGCISTVDEFAYDHGEITQERIDRSIRELTSTCSLTYRHIPRPIGKVTSAYWDDVKGMIIEATVFSRAQVQKKKKMSDGSYVEEEPGFMKKYEDMVMKVKDGRIGQFSVSLSITQSNQFKFVKNIEVAITEKGKRNVGDFHYVKYSGMLCFFSFSSPHLPLFLSCISKGDLEKDSPIT